MTLFDIMPAMWLGASFFLFISYLLSDSRVLLCFCGASLAALCPAVLSARMYIQIAVFFAYAAFVCTALFALKDGGRHDTCIAVTKISCDGGYVMFHGKVMPAFTDGAECSTGDVLRVRICGNGALAVQRS